jgi:thiosulfate dehydrogenase [quinone] large subunit
MDRTNRGIFLLRVVLGGGFLFAGLDKFLMLANGQPFTSAGFLKFATGGQWLNTENINPTKDFWVSLAGNATLVSVIDTLVVFGEIAIGVALILGLATRFAGLMGAFMMALFFVAQMSFANGPFNEQLFYGVIAGTIAYVGAGAYALDSVVSRLPVVGRIPVVKYALG